MKWGEGVGFMTIWPLRKSTLKEILMRDKNET